MTDKLTDRIEIRSDRFHAETTIEFDGQFPSSIVPFMIRHIDNETAVYTHYTGTRIVLRANGELAVCNLLSAEKAVQLIRFVVETLDCSKTSEITVYHLKKD